MASNAKYPQVKVKLVGNDGNAFSILGAVKNALQKANVSKEEVNLFMEEAMAGDYGHLLRTAVKWVDVE